MCVKNLFHKENISDFNVYWLHTTWLVAHFSNFRKKSVSMEKDRHWLLPISNSNFADILNCHKMFVVENLMSRIQCCAWVNYYSSSNTIIMYPKFGFRIVFLLNSLLGHQLTDVKQNAFKMYLCLMYEFGM